MAIDVRLDDIATLLQRWQTEWQAAQAEAMQSACTVLQSEARAIIAEEDNSARLGDNIETVVDGDNAWVGVASGIIGCNGHDESELDIGEEAVAREFGSAVTPPRPFLGAAAARRLDDVGSGLAEVLAGAFRRGLRAVTGHRQ